MSRSRLGPRKLGRGAAVGLIVSAALVFAACSSSSSPKSSDQALVSGGTSASGAQSGSVSASDILSESRTAVSQLTGAVPFPDLPAGPAPAAGQKLFVISADQSLEGSVRAVNGVQAAASLVGWNTTVVDGKSSPEAMNAGVQRAVNEHAAGIVLVYINTALVGAGVAAAHAAKIPIVSIASGNKVGPDGVAADLVTTTYNEGMGRAQAYYAIATSGGGVKAIVLNDTSFTLSPPISEASIAVLKQCGTCQVLEEVKFGATDVVTRLAGLVQTALARHPDANYVFTPYDAAATFAAQGVRQANSKAVIVSTGGNKPNLQLIRSGQVQVATVAEPLEYFGYLAVDAMNRAMHGQQPIAFEAPIKLLTRNNLPAAGQAWSGDSDFTAAFKKLWGR